MSTSTRRRWLACSASRRYCYKSRKLKKFTSPHSIILIGGGSIDFEIESPVDPTTSLQKMAVKGMAADVADGSFAPF
jgi:hypothetical protein